MGFLFIYRWSVIIYEALEGIFMRKIGRERWQNLDMTASIGTARRAAFDPLASTVDCGIYSNSYIVLFSVIENSNTPNSGLMHRLDANFSDLPYLEHP